jgi:hypothetical protein
MNFTNIGGTFGVGSLDLDEAESNPIHTVACESVGANAQDEKISVSPVIGWRDCPELDELLAEDERVQVYAVVESGQSRCRLCWVSPA